MKLGNHIRTLRSAHENITQQDLANAVGVSRLTIHSVETGKFNPSALLAMKIAAYFEKPFEDVFFLVEEDA